MRATIIIATINRAQELTKYTLNSLNNQTCEEFDVIVWDASQDNQTELVCKTSIIHPLYFKAERVGLAKQRNDALDKAFELFPKNEIVLFLDDDVVLSSDAIEGLLKTYIDDEKVKCVGIPISGKATKTPFLKRIFKALFFNYEFKKRHVTVYAYIYYPSNEKNSETVNWLSGCGMSYRKECFLYHRFDERLCTFGGYSLAEDVLFSSQLSQKGFKTKLSDAGFLIHERGNGGRLDYQKWVASIVYNHYLLFDSINSNTSFLKKFFNWLAFKWNQFYNLSVLFFKSIRESETKNFFKGKKEGSKAIHGRHK